MRKDRTGGAETKPMRQVEPRGNPLGGRIEVACRGGRIGVRSGEMQEATATVENCEPSIPHLTSKELAVLGFLTLLALFFVPPVQAETTSSVTPEQFRAWFDAARQGRLRPPDPGTGRVAGRTSYLLAETGF